MLIVISPAKNLDFKTRIEAEIFSLPKFIKYSSELIDRLKEIPASELSRLFQINSKISDLNFDRFKIWQENHNRENSRQAILAFNGEVYNGLQAKKLSKDDLIFAQKQVRILSGLYGVLRPLDLIQPYRLEMGIPLDMNESKNLYEFWGNMIRKEIAKSSSKSEGKRVIINLASQEYIKAIQRKTIGEQIIDIEFLEMRNGKFKPITVYMKKARGMMTRYAVVNRIADPEELKNFGEGGYGFAEDLSDENKWVFVR